MSNIHSYGNITKGFNKGILIRSFHWEKGVWAYKTEPPPFFIDVPVASAEGEQSYIYMLRVFILSLSTI
jgi:hypothetical protein